MPKRLPSGIVVALLLTSSLALLPLSTGSTGLQEAVSVSIPPYSYHNHPDPTKRSTAASTAAPKPTQTASATASSENQNTEESVRGLSTTASMNSTTIALGIPAAMGGMLNIYAMSVISLLILLLVLAAILTRRRHSKSNSSM